MPKRVRSSKRQRTHSPPQRPRSRQQPKRRKQLGTPMPLLPRQRTSTPRRSLQQRNRKYRWKNGGSNPQSFCGFGEDDEEVEHILLIIDNGLRTSGLDHFADMRKMVFFFFHNKRVINIALYSIDSIFVSIFLLIILAIFKVLS